VAQVAYRQLAFKSFRKLGTTLHEHNWHKENSQGTDINVIKIKTVTGNTGWMGTKI